jgi:hypothetical protein
MRRNVEMTLNADTARRFRETAERLSNMNLGDDGLLAATVLLRIAASYERAATTASTGDTIPVEQLNATNDE